MQLNFASPHKSILESPSNDRLNDLVVLSGPNGSGKTNLLEAILLGHISIDDIQPNQSPPQIRLFRLAELVAASGGQQTGANYKDRWSVIHNQVQQLKNQIEIGAVPIFEPKDQNDWLKGALAGSQQLTTRAVEQLEADLGKSLITMTEEDFRRHAPLLTGWRDAFQVTIEELFLSYAVRKRENEFRQFLDAKKPHLEQRALTDERFEEIFGPAPWQLLNEILNLVGLQYQFPPPPDEESVVYEARLTDPQTGASIRTTDLSSGERTLLAISMSLYAGASLAKSVQLPRILLLDEADASLHPAMAKSLLTVTSDIFVARHNVKVILTTHSPTTVALAPEEALYVMSRAGKPRLTKASRDEAVATLAVGLSTLSVRNENRRQVFVESEYDQQYFQEIFGLLRRYINSQVSLEFIASGTGGRGDCNAVLHLVGQLRDRGNQSVFGIVDRDNRKSLPDGIVMIPSRYAIENLILDPLILGAFMVREGILNSDDIGLPPQSPHYQLSASHAQKIIDLVAGKVTVPADDAEASVVEYCANFTANVPRYWLDHQGHTLEERITKAYPQLLRFRPDLKNEVVHRAFRDSPGFIPRDVMTLFKALLPEAGEHSVTPALFTDNAPESQVVRPL